MSPDPEVVVEPDVLVLELVCAAVAEGADPMVDPDARERPAADALDDRVAFARRRTFLMTSGDRTSDPTLRGFTPVFTAASTELAGTEEVTGSPTAGGSSVRSR